MLLIFLANIHGLSMFKAQAFQKILDESNGEQNKIWVDKDSQFFNRSMKSPLKKMTEKHIQQIRKENLLLLKDLSEP